MSRASLKGIANLSLQHFVKMQELLNDFIPKAKQQKHIKEQSTR